MQGPVKEDLIRISTRSSVKDLYRIMHNIFKILTQGLLGKIGKGSSQDLPIRTSTREDFTRISTRSSRKELCKIMQRPVLCEPDLRRAILCGNLQAECPPQKSAARFARACAVDMAMDTSQEPFYAKIQGVSRKRPRLSDNRFVRACAVEMHLDISEEPLYA